MLKTTGATVAKYVIVSILILCTVSTDVWHPGSSSDRIRQYSRPLEFDYIGWEISAIWQKAVDLSFGISHYLNNNQQRQVVDDYFQYITQSKKNENRIAEAYGSPETMLEADLDLLEINLELISRQLRFQTVLAESVFQYQVAQAIDTLGVSKLGSPVPPILFKTTSLPKQLIISPRDTIMQVNRVSLQAEISLNKIITLEESIEENTIFSALVVPIGGVGTYPSMIVKTAYLPNLLDTAAHEWTHNYLIFRPLGIHYDSSSALRTINETTASISGGEIMREVIRSIYPEYSDLDPLIPQDLLAENSLSITNQAEGFQFSEEMYRTRNNVDELLAAGNIEEAEKYMEDQRQVFWEHGYQIRKLNQAYFSFYGAYADSPYSAAGSDPVGEDVRLFRARQPDLQSFIWKISWMSNYRQLRSAARGF